MYSQYGGGRTTHCEGGYATPSTRCRSGKAIHGDIISPVYFSWYQSAENHILCTFVAVTWVVNDHVDISDDVFPVSWTFVSLDMNLQSRDTNAGFPSREPHWPGGRSLCSWATTPSWFDHQSLNTPSASRQLQKQPSYCIASLPPISDVFLSRV